MLNILHSYSLTLFNIINSQKKQKINEWKNLLLLLIHISKKKFFLFYYLYKKNFFTKIILISCKNYIKNIYMKNFINIIIKNNIFFYIEKIYLNFLKIYNNKKKILYIYIYSKHKLNNLNIILIKKILNKKYNSFNLKIFFKKDKYLLAGFKIKINDIIFNATIKNNIKKLKLIFNKRKE